MLIGRYERPVTMEEAATLVFGEGGVPLGGGVWTNHATRALGLAVDLSLLGIDGIVDAGDEVTIGAMATIRSLEISPLLEGVFGGVFARATEHIVGVQLRNQVTLGGSVAGKYGFSDLLTLLSALGAQLVFHDGTRTGIGDFLLAPRDGPFLIAGIAVRKGQTAAFQSLGVADNDFPVLNACAAFDGASHCSCAIARPGSFA